MASEEISGTLHGLAIDLEDWFHPTLISEGSDPSISLIKEPTERLLKFLHAYDVRATFFVVGEVAKRHPGLIAHEMRRSH